MEISGGGSFSGTVFSSSVGMRFKILATEWNRIGSLSLGSDKISIGVVDGALRYTALSDYFGYFTAGGEGGLLGVFNNTLSVWNEGSFQFSKGVQ